MSRDDALTINGLHRNSVHTTIDEDIGIPDTYIHRPIVGLYSNYNYNYNSGSSVVYKCAFLKILVLACVKKFRTFFKYQFI